MIHLGRVKPGSTIEFCFGSFAGSTGAPSATTNFAAADVQVYKDGGTTQRASASGITATADFDSQTGFNYISIDLSDNTTADFWAAGSRYTVVIADVTVDGQTVRFPVGTFRIGMEGALHDTTIATLSSQTSFTLAAGSADDSAYVGWLAYVHDAASAVQCCLGLVSAYTGSTKTVTLAADPGVFTMAAKDNISLYPPSLLPTVRGRTLDVSSGGEAGLDWANVGSPTTSLNLSGTTISTSQAVASVSGAVGSVTGNVGGNVTGSVGSIASGGISAASFTAGAIDAAAIATDAITSAELAATATAEIASAVRTELATELARIDVATSTRLASASYTAPPSAATIAGAVWDEAISGHLTAGTTGAKLNAAASAGDPWSTALPGAYSAGSAGFLVGTYLDAAISTRLATSGYTAPLSAAGTRTALGLASANLDTQLDALPTATENADALLNRDMSAVSDTNSRSPLNALRHIRNKWSVSGTTLTVTKEDDTTSAWTSTLSTNASADPITGSDPA